MLDTLSALMMVTLAVALLRWARRPALARRSRDGRHFQCRLIEVDRASAGRWLNAHATIVGTEVTLRGRGLATTGSGFAVVGRSPEPPAALAVYVLRRDDVTVAIGVHDQSPAAAALADLLADT
jgi:hypothetical protein